jgi:alkanesulfonate monooxygenase SsuD/methylene tetrahydromethanopterin reductase-like flavin-dependent oxidoreductase (luciferase family)
MAAVTKRLNFAITSSTSHEPPFLLARRFSTLDHITNGRFGWNIVTGWKKSAFQAIGLDEAFEHDLRYERSDEYLRVLYKYRTLMTTKGMKRWLTISQALGRLLGRRRRC